MAFRLAALAVLLAAPLVEAQPPGGTFGPPGGPPMPFVEAQPPGGPDGTPGTPSGPPIQTVPVDGGLGLLALAGGAYAVRRLSRRS